MQTELWATHQLADFLVRSEWREIPAEARREASRTLVNFLGCALGGCRDEAVELALRALGPFFGPAHATVIGRGERAMRSRRRFSTRSARMSWNSTTRISRP
jgi:2-methylcitrate dehydratase PrpD